MYGQLGLEVIFQICPSIVQTKYLSSIQHWDEKFATKKIPQIKHYILLDPMELAAHFFSPYQSKFKTPQLLFKNLHIFSL